MSPQASGRFDNPVIWQSCRLWSLWDMLQLPIGDLLWLERRFAQFHQTINFAIGQRAHADYSESESNALLLHAQLFATHCQSIALLATHGAAIEFIEKYKSCVAISAGRATADFQALLTIRAALEAMLSCLNYESKTKVAILLPPEMVPLFEPKEPLFGADVADKFKCAIFDINEAGKCLAFGRATASVFHLMHVVEYGLRSVHACLGLTAPDNPSWGIWLKQIRDERVKRGDRKWPENDYFQDVYSRLDAIKDAQRDPTMHVQTIHTEEEARLIFENTKGLMKKIASRMDENGEPKA